MLKGLGGLGDMGKMLAKAKELQDKIAEMQQRLEELEVEGVAGAGLVRVVCDGKGRAKRVEVDPSLIAPEGDAEEARIVLQDLTVAAMADAQTKAQERAQEEMRAATEGMPLPPGVGFPT